MPTQLPISKQTVKLRLAEEQRRLSAQLLLSVKLNNDSAAFECQDCKYGTLNIRDRRAADVEMPILDSIALLLTTGQPGRDLAVALDKRDANWTLVLATNHSGPTDEERKAADASFLPSGAPQVSLKLYRTPVQSAGAPIVGGDTRHAGQVQNTSLDSRLSLDERSRLLIAKVSRLSALDMDLSDSPSSLQYFSELIEASKALLDSALLQDIAVYGRVYDEAWETAAQTAKVRLLNVYAYVDGASALFKRPCDPFLRSQIRHRWVEEPFPHSAEGDYNISRAFLEAVVHGLGEKRLPDALSHLSSLDSSEASLTLRTTLHPELRLILNIDAQHPPNQYDEKLRTVQAIGHCKRACLCCTRWIECYNSAFRAQWALRYGYGKMDPTWAYPGLSASYFPETPAPISEMDFDVYWLVMDHLQHLLVAAADDVPIDADEEEYQETDHEIMLLTAQL
ncbi:uncharacterized protein LAESUDRAFT_814303 [Laetiporus sulphureus 93-53]|uniref:Uncharacterized protein n=1 Tax=Laetiporus sulphureus 93-53 TaxID=1314785 RepID=A0A165D0E1_9APHY|nr:uncharacterized protein LAESUDRAFT_814303 [Laetiporus sulphureus 93-53]KZT03883.1 hypothetical protein LAESUDRAFT_814303 [Laetiporus sulphureus 93-53]